MRIRQNDGTILLTGNDAKSMSENMNIDQKIVELQNFLGIPPMTDNMSLRDIVIRDMSIACRTKIVTEFYSDCLGTTKRFDCDPITDQPKIIGYYFIATKIIEQAPELANVANANLRWKSSSDDLCFEFTPMQIKKLGDDMQIHITKLTDKYHMLKVWAKSKEADDQVLKTWAWDMDIGV